MEPVKVPVIGNYIVGIAYYGCIGEFIVIGVVLNQSKTKRWFYPNDSRKIIEGQQSTFSKINRVVPFQ